MMPSYRDDWTTSNKTDYMIRCPERGGEIGRDMK